MKKCGLLYRQSVKSVKRFPIDLNKDKYQDERFMLAYRKYVYAKGLIAKITTLHAWWFVEKFQ